MLMFLWRGSVQSSSWPVRVSPRHPVKAPHRGCLIYQHIEADKNGRHFADDIFKCIFLNENVWISLKIPLKFVPKGPINNIPALVQIMAWHRPGDKSLSEPMMVRLPMHICVTRPQRIKPILEWFHPFPLPDLLHRCVVASPTFFSLCREETVK